MPIETRRWIDDTIARPPATDGRIVYAVGDVHGRYDLLVVVLQAIADDLSSPDGEERALLVFLGDYVDRGPRSAEVLATLVWLSRYAEFDVVFLRGNHEEMMLAFLNRPEEAAAWLRFGGADTTRAFGVADPGGAGDLDALLRLRNDLMDRLPASHLAFLRSLESHAVCGDYVFVHAGLRPGVPLRHQSDADLLWIGDEFLASAGPFEKVVVHGHSWTSDAPVVAAHRIGVDTGAYTTGALTVVRLDGSTVEFFQARSSDSGHAAASRADEEIAHR